MSIRHALTALSLTLASAVMPTAAHAERMPDPGVDSGLTGCAGKFRIQEVRAHDRDETQIPDLTSTGLRNFTHWRISLNAGYYYCPDGHRPNQVQDTYATACWKMLDHEHHATFDGVEFNWWTGWKDAKRKYHPVTRGMVEVDDKRGKDERCKTVWVNSTTWTNMTRKPYVRVHYEIVRTGPLGNAQGWLCQRCPGKKPDVTDTRWEYDPHENPVVAPVKRGKPGWFNG